MPSLRAPHRIQIFVLLGLLAAMLIAACGGDNAGPAAQGGDEASADVGRAAADPAAGEAGGRAVAEFAVDLYEALQSEPGNLVFSPYSVVVALGMARSGANGRTATEIDAVLHAATAGDLNAALNAIDQRLATYPGDYGTSFDDEPITLELETANGIWSQAGSPLLDSYLETLARDYGAGLRLVDFSGATEEARVEINDWVSDRTRERIPMLIPVGILSPSTRVVLTNAVYLNAPWAVPFGDRGEMPFTLLSGDDVATPFMGVDAPYAYAAEDGYEAVEIPYIGAGEGQGLSMVLVVPELGRFAEVEASIDVDLLVDLPDRLEQREMFLLWPKFEIRVPSALTEVLQVLGMPTAFGPEADFSGITGDRSLFISAVLHEAFIAVDELGTEAAAATAVAFAESAPQDPVRLTIDRPFLFFIRDIGTGAILFLGRVLDPTQG